jgi:hypothetical protein
MDGTDDGRSEVGELGADSRELAQLRYRIMDRTDREEGPFWLPAIRFSRSDSVEMEMIIRKRLRERIWREISSEYGRKE